MSNTTTCFTYVIQYYHKYWSKRWSDRATYFNHDEAETELKNLKQQSNDENLLFRLIGRRVIEEIVIDGNDIIE